ncbi:copper homeostasis protein CutC, partial [Actinotalea fermentans ATCC 43279 = JCM 9966 = DSM 3133]
SIDGVARLRAMATRAAGRVQIQAGGGVRPQDIAVLVGAGVDAVHLSAKRTLPDDGGPGGGGGAGYDVTDPEVARAARAAVDEALAGL